MLRDEVRTRMITDKTYPHKGTDTCFWENIYATCSRTDFSVEHTCAEEGAAECIAFEVILEGHCADRGAHFAYHPVSSNRLGVSPNGPGPSPNGTGPA